MNRRFDILVAGAGLAGLTVAALLAHGEHGSRLNIRVTDAGERPRFDPASEVALRVSAIASGSSHLYAELGVWNRLARSCPFRSMRVWDARQPVGGPYTLRFDAAEFGVAELGSIVENVLLQHVLLDFLDFAGVELSFNSAIESLQAADARLTVEFADGTSATPELVIGADGIASLVRRHAGIATVVRHYGQSAFVTHLEPEQPHRYTAWQRFLDTGPVALLPLQDGRVSVVWSTSPDEAGEAVSMPDVQLGERLSAVTDRVLGALAPAGPRASFPLQAQHATHYVKPGMALIGDAAHRIHPLAGQGANLGVADAAVLAAVVGEALAAGEHPGDLPVLRRYERARKGANLVMLGFVDGLNQLFASRSLPVAALRNAGMALFNRSGPVRRRAVEVALGVIRS
jgi:2-octaprenylphenol hydroxylase